MHFEHSVSIRRLVFILRNLAPLPTTLRIVGGPRSACLLLYNTETPYLRFQRLYKIINYLRGR